MIHAHSGLRWLLLLALLGAIVVSFKKMKSGERFNSKVKLLGLLTLIFAHIQLLLGVALYFVSDKVQFIEGFMKNKVYRFYDIEHPFGMLIAIALITIGYSKSKKATSDKAKLRKLFLFYTIALVIILITVPWPFRGLGGNLF